MCGTRQRLRAAVPAGDDLPACRPACALCGSPATGDGASAAPIAGMPRSPNPSLELARPPVRQPAGTRPSFSCQGRRLPSPLNGSRRAGLRSGGEPLRAGHSLAPSYLSATGGVGLSGLVPARLRQARRAQCASGAQAGRGRAEEAGLVRHRRGGAPQSPPRSPGGAGGTRAARDCAPRRPPPGTAPTVRGPARPWRSAPSAGAGPSATARCPAPPASAVG